MRRPLRAAATLLAVLVVLGPPAPALAQRASVRAVTLDEALKAAERAPDHLAAAAHAHATSAAVRSAGGLPPTTVTLGTSRLQAKLIAGAQFPLPLFGRSQAARDIARAERKVARADTGRVDLGLRHDVSLGWYELAWDQDLAKLAGAQAERAAQLAGVAHRRFEAGDAPRQDAVQAEAASARAAAAASSQRVQVDAASAGLAALIGWDPGLPVRAPGGLPTQFPRAPSLDSLSARLGSHPVMSTIDAQVAAAQARELATSREQWPLLSVGVETEALDPTLPGPDVRVTLNADVPLLGRRGAERDTAAAERAAVEADRASLSNRAHGALVVAYRRYQAAQEQARGLGRDVVPVAQDAARLAEVAYQQGQSGIVSVLDAQRSLGDVQREWVDARMAAAAALADLEYAAGGAW